MLLKEVVVIGAGVAGLAHARVLADHAEQVTILERDELPATPTVRRGVPQAQHIHYLLVRGLMVLDELFPGLQDTLESQSGAPRLNIGVNTQYVVEGEAIPRADAHIHTYGIARPHLEQLVREALLRQHQNVRIVERTLVQGLVFDGARVTGVQTSGRGPGVAARVYEADLVVDASGRTSKTPGWLAEAGFPVPETSEIDAEMGYATRWYRKPKNVNHDWSLLYQLPSPPDQVRGAVVLEHRDDQWLVSLIGATGDYPPTDAEGFLEFARSLPDPIVYDALKDAEPLSDVRGYRKMPNLWHHYEALTRVPERLILTGDVVCVINPIYGQGMTKAALYAQELDKLLATGSLDSRAFYKRVAALNSEFWDAAAEADLTYIGANEPTNESLAERVKRFYFGAVLYAHARDAQVARAFNRVLNMVDPPTAFLMPRIVFRVLKAGAVGAIRALASR